MRQTQPARSHETIVSIDAPIEDVWKYLSVAEEIARWFAPKMTVEPGVGGFVLADFGPGLEWKTFIEVWEPNRRLRLVETRDRVLSSSPVDMPLEPCRLVQDYFLETEAGRTRLRLVHSGFGSSADWDNEYEGTRGGWAACFFRLQQVLERHRGESVHNILVPWQCHKIDSARALGLIESVAPMPLHIAHRHLYEFSGTLAGLNDSILTVSAQPSPIGSLAYVELLLFGLTDKETASIENGWRIRLAELFPPEAEATGTRSATPPARVDTPIAPSTC